MSQLREVMRRMVTTNHLSYEWVAKEMLPFVTKNTAVEALKTVEFRLVGNDPNSNEVYRGKVCTFIAHDTMTKLDLQCLYWFIYVEAYMVQDEITDLLMYFAENGEPAISIDF